MPLDPQLAPLFEQMANNPDAKATHESTPEEARDAYAALAHVLGEGVAVAQVEDRTIPGPAGEIPVRVYTPEGTGPFGVLVHYHGGGFVIGGLDTHDKECRGLCAGAGCVVIAVDYRLAPEHRYPAAPEDCYAALEWVAANAASLNVDASRIAVGGDSAGGNLSAVVALMARDRGGPALRFQLLVYPCVDARMSDAYASRKENELGPILLLDTMHYFMDHYFGTGAEGDARRDEPMASPLLAESHAGLPPALVITAELDPLRDEGESYARTLEAAGVATTFTRYDGEPHAFFQFSTICDAGKRAIEEASQALKSHLG
ncbi:MAG: alpha/beta hydrolase [Myxococcota bacterium]|jgi:acetyl esterase|nr:alpha/beta hydrolase [Myxococcota bacterium]